MKNKNIDTDKIKLMLEKQGISIPELAAKTNNDRITVWRQLNDISRMKAELLVDICIILNKDIRELIRR